MEAVDALVRSRAFTAVLVALTVTEPWKRRFVKQSIMGTVVSHVTRVETS
jgi:hypothetical protein